MESLFNSFFVICVLSFSRQQYFTWPIYWTQTPFRPAKALFLCAW